jgi:hypothetical protein
LILFFPPCGFEPAILEESVGDHRHERVAWVQYGGGQELWDSLSGQFNIKPLLCLNTGTQWGGWFTREVPSPDAFRGLRYRMPGLGGEVLRRLGASAVTVPGGEIVQSLKSGAIDGAEWVGPWLDMDLGLHKVAGYYYYPGFHEPGTGSALGINKRLWESFDASERRLIEDATAAEYTCSLAEFDFNNALWLRRLRDEGTVKILKFDDSVLKSVAFASEMPGGTKSVAGWSARADKSNPGHLAGFLRARRERPCRCAAEERDEIAPFHCQCLPCFRPKDSTPGTAGDYCAAGFRPAL